MKKQINQIIIVLGFVVAVIGACLTYILPAVTGDWDSAVISTFVSLLPAIFGVTLIFSNHLVVKNFGYVLSAVLVVDGTADLAIAIDAIYEPANIGLLIYSIGLLVMVLGALLYFLIQFLAYCGFVKSSNQIAYHSCHKEKLLDKLIRYKEMQQEKILTEEEFSELKQKMLENSENKSDSIDDLKRWKKLLDQQVITEEEFSKIKADIFCK